MSKKDRVAEYLQSDIGRMNAERFLKAVREHRLLCTVKRVSSSGMSRLIRVYEIQNDENGRPHILQFNGFLGQVGWTFSDKDNAIRVVGCGMDMVFHLLSTTVENLRYYGFDVEPRLEFETNDYMYV